MQPTSDRSSFYYFTEEHRLIADSARKVFADLVYADTECRQQRHSRLDAAAVTDALTGLGLFGEDAAEAGMGSAMVQVQVARESGGACLSYPVLEVLVAHGMVERVQTLHPIAMTLSTKNAEQAELPRFDAGRLTGVAQRVAFADCAGEALLPAVQSGRTVLVRAGLKAASVRLHPRASVEPDYPLHDVRFEGTAVNIVPPPMGEIAELQRRAQLMTAAEISGACRRLVVMTRDYLLSRSQFGQALGGYQALKHTLADAHVRVEAMIAAIDYAAVALDARSTDASAAIAAAKLFAGNAGKRVAEAMLQLHGAIGYTMEYPLQLLLRRVLRCANSHTAHDRLSRDLFAHFQNDAVVSAGSLQNAVISKGR